MTQEQREAQVIDCLERGIDSPTEISRQTGIPRSTARGIISRLQRGGTVTPDAYDALESKLQEMEAHPPDETDSLLRFAEIPADVDSLEAYSIGDAQPEHYIFENRTIRKTLSFGDLHCPFILARALAKAVQSHPDTDVVAIPGDFADAWALSVFHKEPWIKRAMLKIIVQHYNRHPEDGERYGYEMHPILAEVFSCRLVLDFLLRNLPRLKKIIVCWGNHEARLKRLLEKRDVQHLLGIESENLLDVFKDYDERVKIVDHWHFSINDCVFAHIFNFSKQIGKTPSQCVDYFLDKHQPEIDFNAVVVPHTHMSSKFRYRNKFVIEPGCMCSRSYGDDGRLTSVVPSNGYGVIVQENGKTLFNESDFILI